MKRPLRIILIAAIAVIALICAVLVYFSLSGDDTSAFSLKNRSSQIEPVSGDASDDELIQYAQEILSAIGNRDYAAIASVAHPEFGVVFSPYATVDLGSDCCFMGSQIADFSRDNTKYIWGVYDATGEPIKMTPDEYFDSFVFDTDFTKCGEFGVDRVLRSGNSLENITEIFIGCRYVDCYIPGENEESWTSLRLVFEEHNGVLRLSAIVHSENTI